MARDSDTFASDGGGDDFCRGGMAKTFCGTSVKKGHHLMMGRMVVEIGRRRRGSM